METDAARALSRKTQRAIQLAQCFKTHATGQHDQKTSNLRKNEDISRPCRISLLLTIEQGYNGNSQSNNWVKAPFSAAFFK